MLFTEHTLRLHYKDHLVNTFQELRLVIESHTEHTNTLCRQNVEF
jgi:hypothetical protein